MCTRTLLVSLSTTAILFVAGAASAQTAIPTQGQSAETIQADTATCQAQATQSAEAASKQAFSTGMTGNGYTIGP